MVERVLQGGEEPLGAFALRHVPAAVEGDEAPRLGDVGVDDRPRRACVEGARRLEVDAAQKVLVQFSERLAPINAANRDNYVGPPQTDGVRVFSVFCNGKLVLRDLDILKEAGENRPLARIITGLEPNAQGKLLLDFVPIKDYATVTAIEVLPD